MKWWIRIILGVLAMTAFGETHDQVAYFNAKIYSGDELLKDKTAFIVRDSKFFQVGTNDQIKKAIGPKTKTVDLNNALVLPGFIEAHAHLLGIGKSKAQLDLKNLMPDDIAKLVMTQAAQQEPTTWIKGRGWDQNLWPKKVFPHKRLLSSVKNPVYLRRVDGHAVFVNDAALNLAGITKDTADPQGGQIIRDQNGEATGVLIDNAIDLVSKLMTKPSRKDLEHYLALGMDEAISNGITSFHDAGCGRDTIKLYEDFAKSGGLKMRVFAMLDGSDQNLVDEFLQRGPVSVGDHLSIRSIKYFADGALGSRGASLLTHYHDKPGHQGLILMDKEDLIKKTKAAIDAGFQVATHAIGDHANKMVLDAYESALDQTKAKDTRLRIEHAQLIDPSDHHRFKKSSVVASVQPIHCTSDMAWVPSRLGEDRLAGRAYPWRSLLNSGAVLAFGSDGPVEDINPIKGLYSAVTRADATGSPAKGFMPEQKLNLKEALNGYHQGAAYAEFAEDRKGRIKEGFLADFVVMDTDILHPIKSTFLKAKPKMTVVGGAVVYKR